MKARWALIGKQGDGFSEFAKHMLKMSPYQVAAKNGNIYFKTSYDVRTTTKLIQLSKRINKKNYKDQANFRLLNYTSPFYKDVTPFSLADDVLPSIDKDLENEKDFHRFKLLSQYIFYSSKNQLFNVFCDHLAPNFFKWHPNGSVYISSMDVTLNSKLSVLRLLGAIEKIGNRDVKDKEKYLKYIGLADAQPSHIVRPSKYLSIPIALSLPMPIGFLSPRLVDTFIFMFGERIENVRGVFPRSGIEYFQSEASLLLHESREGLSASEILVGAKVDHFSMINKEFSQQEWWNFFNQYVNRLNNFLFYITDPVNFLRGDGYWSNLTQYFVWLNFERICDEVVFLITEENQFLRKMSLFRILDQLASLKEKTNREQVEVFKDFIIPKTKTDIIKDGLQSYHGIFSKYLISELERVRQDLKIKVIDSVVLSDLKNYKTETVNLPTGENISFDEYVREVVRQIRNSAHGYSTNKYLITNSGNISDDISLLGVLAFFAFIANPAKFLRPFWEE
ncbi:MAG: hypothetical protein HS100_03900 [Anaerolineales bacterium]|nr:hypothetical protein [Anaerolineales bacterium]